MTRYLVGWDGSEAADGALVMAAEMAGADDELLVATVIPARLKDRSFLQMLFPQIEMPEAVKANSYEENAAGRLEERLADLETEAQVETAVTAGDPADEILQLVSDRDVDHLVVGYKSYETNLPYHVGSIAEKLIRYSTVPITIYRPKPVLAD